MDPEDRGRRIAYRLREYRQRRNPRNDYTICKFPDSFVGMDDKIQLPKLASFGPCHIGMLQLRDFESHKFALFDSFLRRPENQHGQDDRYYKEKLRVKMHTIRSCYHEGINLPDDEELIDMMLIDGCFMIELFLQYSENRGDEWKWHVLTLISDLLKLENQLPFFVLMDLYECFITRYGNLPRLALIFLNQVFSCPSHMNNHQFSQIIDFVENQDIKHLLDLFRFSLIPLQQLIPEGLQQNNVRHCSWDSLPNLKQLRRVGINVGKREVQSLLEIDYQKFIDFQKFQIPPVNLKIPSIRIDEFTRTILFNCVAMEQRFQNQIKYVTAYVYFLNRLLEEAEDVRFLRSVNVISSFHLEEKYFIDSLNILGNKFYFSVEKCYLWKQVEDIKTYCDSYLASIRLSFLSFFKYESVVLYCAIFQIVVGILSWLS